MLVCILMYQPLSCKCATHTCSQQCALRRPHPFYQRQNVRHVLLTTHQQLTQVLPLLCSICIGSTILASNTIQSVALLLRCLLLLLLKQEGCVSLLPLQDCSATKQGKSSRTAVQQSKAKLEDCGATKQGLRFVAATLGLQCNKTGR